MTAISKSLLVQTFTIDNGQTVSGSADAIPFIDLTKYVIVAVEFPAAITGTGLTLQVSNDPSPYDSYGNYLAANAPSNYSVVYNVTITKQNSSVVPVGATYRTLEYVGKYLQFVSSGSEGAKRTFKAYLVPR